MLGKILLLLLQVALVVGGAILLLESDCPEGVCGTEIAGLLLILLAFPILVYLLRKGI